MYKNFTLFVEAIAPLLSDSMYLVCAGGNAFDKFELELFERFNILKLIVQITPNDSQLNYIYQNAECFVFPSLYEGFGLPILEAFINGCPTVLSNTSSLPEIGGEAAQYFNPLDIHSIRESVHSLLNNKSIKNNLIESAYDRIKTFSSDCAAQNYYNTYRKIL